MEVAIEARKYLKKYKISNEIIIHKFAIFLRALHNFIDRNKLNKKVEVNRYILAQLVVDYYVDSVRVKEFHKIKNTNTEKTYAYSAYWLNRRKPIQIIKNFKGCEFVNEVFVTTYLISNIASEKGYDNAAMDKNPMFKQFQTLLFYNLKYRITTQQSIELMIEAFFFGCDFSTNATPPKTDSNF